MLTASQQGETLRLVAEENFIFTNAESLQKELLQAVKSPPGQGVILDLTKTQIIDSIGVKLLVGLYQSCKAKGTPLALEVASESVMKVLSLCKLNQIMEVRQS